MDRGLSVDDSTCQWTGQGKVQSSPRTCGWIWNFDFCPRDFVDDPLSLNNPQMGHGQLGQFTNDRGLLWIGPSGDCQCPVCICTGKILAGKRDKGSMLMVQKNICKTFKDCEAQLQSNRQSPQLVSFCCSLGVRCHSRWWKKSGYILSSCRILPNHSLEFIYLFIYIFFNFGSCINLFPKCIENLRIYTSWCISCMCFLHSKQSIVHVVHVDILL